jgi:hypothetical protein
LEQIPKELDCKRDVAHVLRVAAKAGIELESDSIPSFSVSLIEGMNDGEAVEGVVLEIKLFIAFSSKDHVESEFPVVPHFKVLVSCLLLEERNNDRVILDFISNSYENVGCLLQSLQFLIDFCHIKSTTDQVLSFARAMIELISVFKHTFKFLKTCRAAGLTVEA